MSENIVKKVCKELGITQKELAEIMGVNEGTPNQWVSKESIPEWATKFMILLLENEKNKKSVQKFKEFLSSIE